MGAIILLCGMIIIGFMTIMSCLIVQKTPEERMLEDEEQLKFVEEYRKKKEAERNTKNS